MKKPTKRDYITLAVLLSLALAIVVVIQEYRL